MRVLISAGPTREPIDAVRYIGNRSSGRMGLALAEAASRRGHEVTLLLGPIDQPVSVSPAVAVHRFESTADLRALLAEHAPSCDALVMAAAVADYRPRHVHEGKLARAADAGATLTIVLEPTPDLLAELAPRRRPGQRLFAFALEEPASLEPRATQKLRRKAVDAIVANPLGTMQADDVEAVVLWADGRRAAPGLMSKPAFAAWMLEHVIEPQPSAPGQGVSATGSDRRKSR